MEEDDGGLMYWQQQGQQEYEEWLDSLPAINLNKLFETAQTSAQQEQDKWHSQQPSHKVETSARPLPACMSPAAFN